MASVANELTPQQQTQTALFGRIFGRAGEIAEPRAGRTVGQLWRQDESRHRHLFRGKVTVDVAAALALQVFYLFDCLRATLPRRRRVSAEESAWGVSLAPVRLSRWQS